MEKKQTILWIFSFHMTGILGQMKKILSQEAVSYGKSADYRRLDKQTACLLQVPSGKKKEWHWKYVLFIMEGYIQKEDDSRKKKGVPQNNEKGTPSDYFMVSSFMINGISSCFSAR